MIAVVPQSNVSACFGGLNATALRRTVPSINRGGCNTSQFLFYLRCLLPTYHVGGLRGGSNTPKQLALSLRLPLAVRIHVWRAIREALRAVTGSHGCIEYGVAMLRGTL